MATEIEILDWAVLRAAAWPIEITDRFAAPRLAESVNRIITVEREILAQRADTLAALEKTIPAVPERRARAWLLTVKRLVYNGLDTIPDPPADVAALIEHVPGFATERAARARRAMLIWELDSAHDAELSRQRAVLADITAETRFARALVLANPRVARAWQHRPANPPTRARQRRLETTVFRYLMRAIGRATPQGAWAGVTPVAPDGREGVALRVIPARRRYSVHVDLAPFATAASVLSGQARYRRGYPLRANPTLHDHDGTWWYERGAEWVAAPDNPLVAPILDAYADGAPRPAEPLLDVIASVSATPERLRSLLDAALDLLLERGALRSALEFPPVATNPAEALGIFVGQLIEPDRSLWNDVVASVGGLCACLADGFDRLSPDEVGALIARIRSEVARIMSSVGLDLAPESPLVQVDMAAPFEVTWTAEVRAAFRDSVRELFTSLATAGRAELFRTETVGRILQAAPAVAHGVPLVELFHLMSGGSSTATGPAVPGAPGPGPGGTLVFTLGGNGFAAEWGRPQPAIFAARFAELLAGPVAALRRLMRTWSAIEIAGVDPLNRNAAMRPDLVGRQLCAHAPEAAQLTVRLENGRPWLLGPDERLLPVYSSAALIGLTDPCSRVLYNLAMSHGWELVCGESPARRWTIDASTVESLLAHKGSTRYLAWRRVVERMELPALVWLGRDQRQLLIRTDSPLAVACLSRDGESDGLVLSALPADPARWPVRDNDGNHYLAEIAITWLR